MQHALGLYIFRRDLRLDDNTALSQAARNCISLLPCFIFDPRQVGTQNTYRSEKAIQFMIESLQDLRQQITQYKGHLYIFCGKAEEVVKTLLTMVPLDAVFFNQDYTPFSKARDERIHKVCAQYGCSVYSFHDALLTNPDHMLTRAQKPYRVFSAFYKAASSISVTQPIQLKNVSFYTKKIRVDEQSMLISSGSKTSAKSILGGTQESLKILDHIGNFKDYAHTRDIPSLPTTHLSAHLKFGTISIRTAYNVIGKKLGAHHPLITQLYWRDFFTYIAYHTPSVFGQPFQKKYSTLAWHNSKKLFKAWCTGRTGFPLVDAGMRELEATGFMHNRLRMITASFLVKDLHINWLWGERYFAQKLVDYDPALNNGNWQWIASTGTDAQPYFRIFNPWLQQKKFDPHCTYIHHWVPELKKFSPQIIHTWYKQQQYHTRQYAGPLIDHHQQAIATKILYKKLS